MLLPALTDVTLWGILRAACSLVHLMIAWGVEGLTCSRADCFAAWSAGTLVHLL